VPQEGAKGLEHKPEAKNDREAEGGCCDQHDCFRTTCQRSGPPVPTAMRVTTKIVCQGGASSKKIAGEEVIKHGGGYFHAG